MSTNLMRSQSPAERLVGRRITDAMRAAAPAPLYGCAGQACCSQHAWPAAADDLHWYRDGFYCWSCLDDFDSERDDDEDHTITIGPSLADVLAAQPATAVARYLGDNR